MKEQNKKHLNAPENQTPPSKKLTSLKPPHPPVKGQENEEEAQADWEDFEEITKGDFKRLLGCG